MLILCLYFVYERIERTQSAGPHPLHPSINDRATVFLPRPGENGNMNATHPRKVRKKPRITLTKREIADICAIHGSSSVAQLAKRTGLSYMQLYNIVHRRVRSVSYRTYLQLFGQPPPRQAPLRVDGALFRALVELWLFLDGRMSKAELYRELFQVPPQANVDHRIFSGRINQIDASVENAMLQKFAAAGIEGPELDQWLAEFDTFNHDPWVPYASVRPALLYLESVLGIHPTSVLGQSVVKYETGLLKRVSKNTADHIRALKKDAEKALRESGPQHMDTIRDSILGGRTGYTLFSEIEEDLLFLIRHTGMGAKSYLGRSLWTYRNGKAKRVADWRARRIAGDCDRYIHTTPGLRLSHLPPSRRRQQIRPLIAVMMARSTQLLSGKDGMAFEKRVLRPSLTQVRYRASQHGFTPFDMASRVLGMRRRAFDLMVASHCEIFRFVGKFSTRWYLPDLYLKELSRKKDFGLIAAKYERLANERRRGASTKACLN